jgi:hypothetical protein
VKRENPGLTNAEVSRVLAAIWKQCTDDEKKSYIDKEFTLRQKYKIAIAEWRANKEKEKEVQQKEVQRERRNGSSNYGGSKATNE